MRSPQPKECWSRPVGSGNHSRDLGKAFVLLPPIGESLVDRSDLVSIAAPLADEASAGLDAWGRRVERIWIRFEHLGKSHEPPLGRWLERTVGLLLQPEGESPDQKL